MQEVYIIKIGGNIIDDEAKLTSFLKDFAYLETTKILVHGGGKLATSMAEELKIPQKLVDGRRITDAETLKVITMVYAGYINKKIVAQLQGHGCNAIGLSGADGNMVQAHKRIHHSIDYGFVGDIDSINNPFIELLLSNQLMPVIAPVSHDQKGQMLNTNADTIAFEIAKSLSPTYTVSLIYCFEKEGVLQKMDDESSVIKHLAKTKYHQLKADNGIFAGMIPKLDNAFSALDNGVSKVVIGNSNSLHNLINGSAGTTITQDDE